jgi:hypothetical protein
MSKVNNIIIILYYIIIILFTLLIKEFTWHKLKMFEKKHEKHTLRAFLKKN